MNKISHFLAIELVLIYILISSDNNVNLVEAQPDEYGNILSYFPIHLLSTIPHKILSLANIGILFSLLNQRRARGLDNDDDGVDDDGDGEVDEDGDSNENGNNGKKKNMMFFIGKHNIQVSNHDMKYDSDNDDDDDDEDDDDEDDDDDKDDHSTTETPDDDEDDEKEAKKKKKDKKKKKKKSKSKDNKDSDKDNGNNEDNDQQKSFFQMKKSHPWFQKFWPMASMSSKINIKTPMVEKMLNKNNHIMSSPNGFPLGGSKLDQNQYRRQDISDIHYDYDKDMNSSSESESQINSVLSVPQFHSLLYSSDKRHHLTKRDVNSDKEFSKRNSFMNENENKIDNNLMKGDSHQNQNMFKTYPNYGMTGSFVNNGNQNLESLRMNKNFSNLLSNYLTNSLVYTSDYNPFSSPKGLIIPTDSSTKQYFPNSVKNNFSMNSFPILSPTNLRRSSPNFFRPKALSDAKTFDTKESFKSFKTRNHPLFPSNSREYSQMMPSQEDNPYYGSTSFDDSDVDSGDSDDYSSAIMESMNNMKDMNGMDLMSGMKDMSFMSGMNDMSLMSGMKGMNTMSGMKSKTMSPIMSSYMKTKSSNLPVMDLSYWTKLLKQQEKEEKKKKKKITTTESSKDDDEDEDDEDDEDDDEEDDDDDEEEVVKKEKKFHTTVQVISSGSKAGNIGISSGSDGSSSGGMMRWLKDLPGI